MNGYLTVHCIFEAFLYPLPLAHAIFNEPIVTPFAYIVVDDVSGDEPAEYFVVTVLADVSIPSNFVLSDADIKPLAEVVAVPPVSATVPPRHQPPLIGVAHLDLALVADEHMHIIDELHDRHTPAERTPVDGLDRPIVAYPFVTALAVRSTAVTAVFPETRKVLVHRTFARTARGPVRILQQKLADAKQAANTQAILAAVVAKDTLAVSGTSNSTAGTWTGTGTLS